MIRQGVVELIGEGGSGSEAQVFIELRTEFPGLGGTIYTREGVVAALREEFNHAPKSGHKMFLRHTIIKKLDDYFYRKGVYIFSHIPRPFGSISLEADRYEAYLYEWAFGSEGHSWRGIDNANNQCAIQLSDWKAFVDNFVSAGIDVSRDITDPDDGRVSRNIIHQYPKCSTDGIALNSLWKRIDFGTSSIYIDWDSLKNFLESQKADLIRVLKSDRYEMLLLAVKYLTQKEKMEDREKGMLEVMLGYYRSSNLSHFARGMGPTTGPPYFGSTTQRL